MPLPELGATDGILHWAAIYMLPCHLRPWMPWKRCVEDPVPLWGVGPTDWFLGSTAAAVEPHST